MPAVRTTCPYCGVGCGVIAGRREDGSVEVRGDPAHPANHGRLCSKGTALADTVGLEGRLLAPQVDGRETGWDEALDEVARRFADTIRAHGPDSVAFYLSGQLLTEDYYVANKLAKGWIGTANVDTNSRLCMASAVVGHQRAFGEDLVPVDYADLEQASLVVLVGSNAAWCHPVVMQRILAARETAGLRLVVVDPRRTASCDAADLHLALRPGTDVPLFNGLLAFLAASGHADAAFVAAHTAGLPEALAAARSASSDIEATAQACGLEAAQVQAFFELFARHERVVTLFSQGVNQSSAGTDKVNAIINCHLLTGRIGRSGSGPFSITGQPNAMGGREVGGLATQLAAHLSLEDPAHREAVQRFWDSPRIPERAGLKAVDLFDAIDAGRVRAVWIVATNPVVSLPDADVARRALERCEFVVVSDCVADTDTARLADVLLPAVAWGEKDGTVTNSERRISRQRAFLPVPGDARPDWWAMCEVARRMGFAQGFQFESAARIFDEHARLTGVAAGLGRSLDLTALAGLDDLAYDAMAPVQWPVPSGRAAPARPFADGRFATPDGRARFVATPPRAPRHPATDEFPLLLNTGRIRDQWHTMTRTARAPQLNAHEPEPYLDLHVEDALAAGVEPGSLAQLSTRWGRMIARARCSGDVPRGQVFSPMHWSDPWTLRGRVGALVNPVVDPASGEPEFKHTPARIEPWTVAWQGFVLSRERIEPPAGAWWARSPGVAHQRYELAGDAASRPSAAWLRDLAAGVPGAEIVEYEDERTGTYRAALLSGDRLEVCLFVSVPARALPPREWLAGLFALEALAAEDRRALLGGRAPGFQPAPGPVVCACHRVGSNTLRDAIEGGCVTLAQLGARTRAGTNCGSCRPELSRMIARIGAPSAEVA